ncbi:hypothetical protein FUA26_02605 [Seonamhaeicola algicola]|uniref:Uncharacterized protein n=1 Tax=Seonamhaeicola algicola TaxID=1719036 RepID=A0A5C7AWZ6_9FLAO|nr:hypothetical protein [Seonamhaeicola algicola]TXE12707.1 hypothetical protein FUA26_02605 [Seonamhaeicola algicola]
MKTKITLLSIFCLFFTLTTFAQKKHGPLSFIKNKVTIEKYHNAEDLKNMPKGEVLNLYMERVEALTQIIPYMAFATKPGVTMATLGIPNSNENRKQLEAQHENAENYLEGTVEFQKVLLPYSDTSKLVAAVLFYESIMKSIHSYEDFY